MKFLILYVVFQLNIDFQVRHHILFMFNTVIFCVRYHGCVRYWMNGYVLDMKICETQTAIPCLKVRLLGNGLVAPSQQQNARYKFRF